jgi:hypothetical protein
LQLKKRINIITGHYGSGKTNFAVNLALDINKSGKKTCLVDLDIVNPYFRAADMTAKLEREGIRVIAPIYANTNLDIPALPGEIYSVFDDSNLTAVLDVGGDDAGAAALGRYSGKILAEDDYEHFYVINARRALTETPEEAAEIMREIEAAGHVPVTAIVNNTNLCHETDAAVISASMSFAHRVAELTGLPLVFTCAPRAVAGALKGCGEIYPVDIYVLPPWEKFPA